MYKYDCIEEARIGKTLPKTDINDGSQSHCWNDGDYDFEYQLDQWGVERLFHNLDEVLIRELKMYVEYREKLNIKDKRQLLRTLYLEKYVSLDLYDEDLEELPLDMKNFNMINNLAGY